MICLTDFQHDDFRRTAEAQGQHAASQPPGDQERGAVQAGPGIGEFDFFPGDAAQGNAAGQADLAAVGVGADHGVRRAGLQQGEDVRHMGEQDVGDGRGEAQREFLRPDPHVVVVPHGGKLELSAARQMEKKGVVPHRADAEVREHVFPRLPSVVLVVVALHGKDAQRGPEHPEVAPRLFRAHAAFPGVAVGIVPQQKDHVRPGLHDFFHIPARLPAAARAQVEVPGHGNPQGRAGFRPPLGQVQGGRDGLHAPRFSLLSPHGPCTVNHEY